MNKPRIVLCGSMSQHVLMKKLDNDLKKLLDIEVIIPSEDEGTYDTYFQNKRMKSVEHFDKVASEKTDAILVVNSPKNGIQNYIGANTYAEIALAMYFGKKIFILNDIYKNYEDELIAWNVICLKGNLTILPEELTFEQVIERQ